MNVRTVAAAAITWAFAGAAAAGPQAAVPSDDTLAAALQACRQLTIFDHVTGRVEGDAVVLTGKVTSGAKKAAAERQVAAIAGVREVRSGIAVLPVSSGDDDLRYRVSRAIYGHPTFWSYAALPNPPIHIIVENGQVTLAGVVNSQVERAMARSLASGRGERAIVDELHEQPGGRTRAIR